VKMIIPNMKQNQQDYGVWEVMLCKVAESTNKFLLITNLMHFFMYLCIHSISTCFEQQVLIIRRSNCINTSSGMISLCKWLLVMLVRTGIPNSHLHRLIIPDDVVIQFDILMMSTVILETCRDMK
jgi:hypothetical protein